MPNPRIERHGEIVRYKELATLAGRDDLIYDLYMEMCDGFGTYLGPEDMKPSMFPEFDSMPGDIFCRKPSYIANLNIG